ncbi:MAG: ABC-2 family transporter protein [Chloroflexota bacterium]|nr:ABC-2 family transporter protein [Chloroflexota bacterium]
MFRYLEMIGVFAKNSMQNEAAYRVNLLTNILLTIVQVSSSIAGLLVIYTHTQTIRGWTFSQTLALLGVFIFTNGLTHTFIAPNLNEFAEGIRKGTLDFTLVKPANSQFLASFQRVNIWGTADVLVGLGLVVYAVTSGFGEGVGLLQVLAFLGAVLCGTVIIYSLWIGPATVAFWTVKIDNITSILQAFYNMGRFPVQAYPAWLQRLLTFVVPVAFVTTVPVQALSSQSTPLLLLASAAVAAVMLWLSTRLWKLGLSQYTSASS